MNEDFIVDECTNGYTYASNLFIQQKPVAYMCISGVNFAICNKEQIPNNFIMFMQKHILGIKWIIIKDGE